MKVNRRELLKIGVATALGSGAALRGHALTLQALSAPVEVANPLEQYPERDWEKVYLDQYAYDSSFTYVCSPNDTHACRVRAFLRHGIVTRIEQPYDVQQYSDLAGQKATAAWHPRMCLKGYTFHRRAYGPSRLKRPLIRRGWQEWADAGFPELTPENRKKYKFDSRGTDDLLPMPWDQAYDYIARGMVHIARTYSGPQGTERLRKEGYPPEMVQAVEGAGTRTFKCRGGMGLTGAIGKYGMYRFSNMLALLDSQVRGVGPDQAKGGRNWSNYTWHGDQDPGTTRVPGMQASDCDFN